MNNSREWRRYEALLDANWMQEPKFILVTDIAGFFQTIPHSILRRELDGASDDVRALLLDYLRVWNPRGMGFPQRVLGSSLLANIYLSGVDAVLGDYASIRWMDDIAVFCGSRREGVEAFLRVEQEPEPLGTVSQSRENSTGAIRGGRRTAYRLPPPQVEYILDSGFPEAEARLSEIWEDLLSRPEMDRTKFSFCVTRFIDHDIPEGVGEILSRLESLPHVSDHASRYLRSQLENPAILNRLLLFFRSRRNQFWWQEYRLATLFWYAERLTPLQKRFVRRRVANANTHWATRSVYMRVLGRHGSNADARGLAALVESEVNPRLQRAALIAAAESNRVSKASLGAMGRFDDDPQSFSLDFLGVAAGASPTLVSKPRSVVNNH